jgi:hypothetical protein
MTPSRPRLALLLCTTLTIACSDGLPTEAVQPSEPVRFALSETEAQAFAAAFDDVGERILPALVTADESRLAALLAELTSTIATRDQLALQRALQRMTFTLDDVTRDDETKAAFGSDLDALRLILEQARPLADAKTNPSR